VKKAKEKTEAKEKEKMNEEYRMLNVE